MAWSTSQLAELAGTTLKTVRHYHRIGLLDEPERASNGYKQYGIAHLVRLLRIKRLTDLDVPLAQIAAMGESTERPDEALRIIDAELAASIERLQRVRAELAMIIQHQAPTDLPPGFSPVATDLSEADRALILIYSRVFGAPFMDDLRDMLETAPRTAADGEFDALPADADAETRQSLAERMAPQLRDLPAEHPIMSNPAAHTLRGAASMESTVVQALVDLYNPAQLDVMKRAYDLLQRETTETETP